MILCLMPYQFEESQLWNVFLVMLLVLGLLAWSSCVMDLLNAKERGRSLLEECCEKECDDAVGSSVKET